MSTSDALNPNFALPDMGDYYYDAPDQQMFYAELDEAVNPLHRANASETAVSRFYQETPPNPGAVNETYTFTVSLGGGEGIQQETEKVRGITVEDGDTIAIPISMISAGDDASASYLKRITDGAADTANAVGASASGAKLKIRFAGLDCKELPHFTKAAVDEVTREEDHFTIEDAKKDGSCIWSQYKSFMDSPITLTNPGGNLAQGTFFDYARKEESANFVKMVDGCWHQYFGMGNDMYVLRKSDANDYSEEMITDAGIARDVVVNAISQATEMRIQIDGAKLSKNGNQIVTKFRTKKNDSSVENSARKFLDLFFDNYTEFTNAGFNYWGLDSYGRAIGVVYVNLGGKWVNLNKMVIADTDWTVVNKYAGGGDGAIDTSGYDFDAKLYADSIYAQSKKFDDRDEVQGKIFGALGKGGSIKAMSDWTVTIGDVTLFVPPTSIRCLTQSKSQHLPILRAKGTMAKSPTKVQRVIEMDIYFNEDRGINGYKLETNTRADGKGQAVTYYMNGLRALYAQFRVAPFLPIDNKYVNEVLGVDAVSMLSFSCDTVPNFPKLIKATLQMSEFEYRIYMPEIPWDGGDDDDAGEGIRNYFSEQINYPLLRYYYQRLLMHGNELENVKFLDDKYITGTFGNRTCLVPMKFKDPYVHFYIPNKENLDKLKAAKIARATAQGNSADSTKLDAKDQEFANDLSKLDNEVDYIQSGGDSSQSTMADLNDYLKNVSGDFILQGHNTDIVVREKTATGYAMTAKSKEIEDNVRSYLSKIYDEYSQNLGSVVNAEGNPLFTPTGPTCETKQGADSNSMKLCYGIGGDVDVRYMSEDEMKKLKTLSTASGGNFSADEVMQNRHITIPISINMAKLPTSLGADVYGAQLGQENAEYFKLDDSKDLGFLRAASKIAEKSGAPDDLSEVNKNINFVTKDTIKFEPYNDTENYLVEGIHINTSNTFSQITLQETNGFAPQYMGGTDININISMYTKSRQAAASMNLLPSISAEYARNYRLVLTAWPLRIESEFTKMFGITDVMVEAVEVDTVPNFPDLYHISLTLVSVDRTLRNREAMQKKDMKNFHNLSVEGVAAERTWDYDQMNKYLSEAELYPDLELPTIAELADAGFNFIRYSNESRIYPDPDFYFCYSYVLMSQLIREAVLNGLNSTASEITMLDSMGNRMEGNLNTSMGAWQKNYEPDTTDEIQNLFRDDDEKIAARMICDFSDASKKNREEVWTIAPNIKVAFTEQRITNHLNDMRKQEYQASKGQTPVPAASPTNPGEKGLNAATPQGGADDGSGQQTAAQAAYDEAVAKKYDEYTKTVCQALDAALSGSVEYTDLESTTRQLYEAFGEADRAPFASDTDNALDDANPAISPLSNSSPWEWGMMDKWLDAAADALCPNGNCDYSPELDEVGATAGLGAAAGAIASGAAAGAVAGTTAGVVGAAAGAVAGAVAGSITGATGHGLTTGAPWKANTEPRAKIVFSEGDVRRSFRGTSGMSEEEWNKYAIYNSVEFGPYNFRFYTEDELESRFGEFGKVSETARANARFGSGYLADPFYREQPKAVQNQYVKDCLFDSDFAKKAFFRICLLYLRVMVSYDIIPSFSYDVFRGAIKDTEMMQKVLEGIQGKRNQKAQEEQIASEKGKARATSLRWLQKKAESASKDVEAAQKDVDEANKKVDEAKKKLEEAQKKQSEKDDDAAKKAVEAAQKEMDDAKKAVEDKQKVVEEKKKAASAATQDKQPDLTQQNQAESLKGIGDNGSLSGNGTLAFEQYVNLFKKNQGAVDNGKTFLMVLVGVLDGDSDFMKILMNRQYSSLNNLTHSCMNGNNSPVNSGDDGKTYMGKARSFIRALAGEKVIDEAKIGAGETQEPSSAFSQFNGRKNIAAAADDPSKYMVHSFYDMIVHDCRGRMLRAFPTFYLILIDEGRKIGRWKLHDNFYNVNSIASITVSKSRKMPTDTAEIVMSNFYNTFTDNDENLNNNYTANFTDVFRSIWLPTMESYAKDQEEKRENAGDPERFRLRAGARVHIRFGYGADASALPTTFNGVVAECETSDTVTLICQSDGIEICKPIMLDKEAWDLPGIDNLVGFQSWGQNGATPKQILQSLLNYKGGAINSYMHDKGWDDVANMVGDPVCPLGIYHFGNPDVNYGGEPETMQNILEVGMANPQDRYCPNPSAYDGTATKAVKSTTSGTLDGVKKGAKVAGIGGAIAGGAAGAISGAAKVISDYVMEPQEPPKLNFEVFGKTVWDVLNIVKSVEPSYYAAVVPFHLRSSIFMGRGHDYYAYDYENVGGQWVEKRKPYQQAHLYDSCTDIITNTMKVSTKDIKTCAIGMYEVSGFMNAKVQKKTDPQWVDSNIYPEYQKTMYVDTKLFGEPSRKLGKISDAINALLGGVFNSTLDRAFDDKGDCQNHHATAVKMTIDALKQQMKEMYAGQMTIIGDPTVKPNDRLLINDSYDGIAGQCLVRDVVHVFSADAGYKTIITPDLITAQTGQDAAEESKLQEYGLLAANAFAGSLATAALMHFSHKTADQLRKVTAFVDDKAPKLGRAIGNKTSTAITQIKSSNKLAGLAKGAENLLGPLKNVAALGKVGSAAGTVVEAGATLAKGAWTVAKAANVPIAIVSTLALSAAEDFVTSKVKSRKRLVLFPLQKYNKPMVGGIDGNVGTVYGSPNFDPSEDSLGKMFGGAVKDAASGIWDRMTGSQKQAMQDSMQASADRQKQAMEAQQKLANSDEGKAQLVYRKLNNSQIEFFRNAYFNPAKTRMEVHKRSSVKRSQLLYGVYGKDQDGINDNPNFAKMRPVIGDKRVKDSMDLGFFRVAAFERGFTSEISSKVRCLYIKDQKTHEYIPVNAIVDGNGTIDIPYLHGEALGVLCDIVKRAFSYMAGTEQSRDAAKWYKDNAGSFITLTSAIKCGSTKNYEATGFSFVLTASDGKSLQALTQATEQLNNIMAQGHAKAEQIPEAIIDVKTTGQDVFIVVHPPEDAS